jgi:hypothetical protein
MRKSELQMLQVPRESSRRTIGKTAYLNAPSFGSNGRKWRST